MYISSNETAVNIPGPVGNLEGILALPIQNKIQVSHLVRDALPDGVSQGEHRDATLGSPSARTCFAQAKSYQQAIGIICHPHPLYGGTMHNKVVTTTSRIFSELGLVNVRFNFRGVGESAGHYGNTIGETEDLISVVDWLRITYPEYKLWLAGFSFGSYISACVAKQASAELLLSIAPPVNHFDFISLKKITCPWIVVQGDKDEIVPAEEVYSWIDSFKLYENKLNLIRMPMSTHFFHGHLTELKNKLMSELNNYLP